MATDNDRNRREAYKLGPFALGSGGPNQALATCESFAIPRGAKLELQGIVYRDGSPVDYTLAPNDAPAGTFQLWISGDDSLPYSRVTNAETSDGMLLFSLTGDNAAKNAVANFEDVPGVRGKILFVRTATGSAGANARALFIISRDPVL